MTTNLQLLLAVSIVLAGCTPEFQPASNLSAQSTMAGTGNSGSPPGTSFSPTGLNDPQGPPGSVPTTPTDFYVSGGGTDAGICTSNAPCATISYATQQALTSNLNCSAQTVHIGVGGWNESVNVTSHCNQLIYSGAGTDQTTWNGDSSSCGVLIANAGTDVLIQSMTMEGAGNSCQSVLFAQTGGVIEVLDGIAFGPTYSQHMHAEGSGSDIEVWNDYVISGGAGSHIGAVADAQVGLGAVNVTINNGPTFSVFMVAQVNAVIAIGGTQFSGPLDGQSQQYSVTDNATIWTEGAGCSSIPGNTPGSTGSNGVCD